MKQHINAPQVIHEVVACSTDADGSIQRLLYTPAWLAAQRHLQSIMDAHGFTTYFDSIGNLFGRMEGADNTRTILTGSHIDTVKNCGRLDGLYGIAGGIEAVLRLVHAHGRPACSLEVVSFAEEEGSRFPYAFWGSKNLAGTADPAAVSGLQDEDGLGFADQMQACGFAFGPQAARRDIAAFVELHIEQGAVLERQGADIGVVEAIVGQKRFSVKITGAANHAGTTPMAYRRDALACAAEIIAEIRNRAIAWGDPLVATVGKIEALPGGGNVIASHVEFTVDIRHTDAQKLSGFEAHVLAMAEDAARRHGTGLAVSKYLDTAPTPMCGEIVSLVEAACRKSCCKYIKMPSGAGHDAQIMAGLANTGMIFVPSRDGISHSPLECTSPQGLASGVDVLAHVLHGLAYAQPAPPNDKK